MPPENFLIGLLAASCEVELLEQPVRRTPGLAAADPLQAGEEDEVLGGGEQLVDRGVLAGDAEQLADDVRLAPDVDAEDGRLARVDREQGGEHLEHGGLAGAVGAEHAEDLAAADGQVDGVDGALVAERLDEAVGVDGQRGVLGRRVSVPTRGPAVVVAEVMSSACCPPVSRHPHAAFTGIVPYEMVVNPRPGTTIS